MNLAIFIVSLFVIVSKFLDCYTTSIQITSISQERNPIARKMMRKFGVQTTIWAIFFLSITIVSISVLILFVYFNTIAFKILFIVSSLIISIFQFAVAYTNKTKRLNIFTKLLLRMYNS